MYPLGLSHSFQSMLWKAPTLCPGASQSLLGSTSSYERTRVLSPLQSGTSTNITCFLVHACMQLCCVSTWNGTTRPACMLHCSKCRQTTVQSGRTKRYSHQLCLRVPTAPYPSKMKEISLTFKAWYNFRAELYFDRTSQCATSYGIQEL